jgi:Lar family restriction alleviation protein
MKNIKECPFCGSANVEIKEDQSMVYYGGAYYAEYQECKSCSKLVKSSKEAISAWNRRLNA